jgi:hypothetical protein
MKRRHVLLSAVAALCGTIGYRYASGSDESAIIKVIHKRLSYLRLDDAGVRRFASDLRVHHMISSFRLRTLDASGPLYTGLALDSHDALDDAIRHGEERVTTQYLICSDFFKNGADQSRVVNYLGYFDPMVACSAPFARPMTMPANG